MMPERRNVSLTYGSSTLELSVPASFMAGDVVQPRALPPRPRGEILAALQATLEAPIGRPRLRELVRDRKVVVVISDEFRAGLHEVIIEALCVELAQGAPREVVFICATGTHEPEVYCLRIGPWVDQHAGAAGLKYRFVAHSCDDPRLVPIGRSPMGTDVILEPDFLDADVRVYGHESKHHYMNGYSVVDKQVLPGISARRTVEMNHKRSLSDDSGPGRNPWHTEPGRQANPFAEDMRDIRMMAERTFRRADGSLEQRRAETFALDMISDKDSLYWAASGDPDTICRLAVQKADEQAQITVRRARYVLISPGGPPASQALYGVQNCFDMAMKGAVLPGGEVLVVAPCEGRPDLPPDVRGIATSAGSKKLFWDTLVALKDRPIDECRQFIEDNFKLYMWKTFRVLKNYKDDRLTIHLHSKLGDDVVRQGGFVPVKDPQAWIDERAARGDGLVHVIDNGNKTFILGT
jgi:nickel-dependent lactate racemase